MSIETERWPVCPVNVGWQKWDVWHVLHGARVSTNVLLQDQNVGKLLMAYRALVHHSEGWLGSVHAHVSLQVALSGERSATDFALEGPFASMYSVMHLKSRLAAEDSVTHHTLVRISNLLLNILDQSF